MVTEATLAARAEGLAPQGEGWFILNARDAAWETGEFGAYTRFEGDARFGQVGINIGVLAPGQASCYYHAEDEQEDFLVLAGECLLIIEGEERALRQWDFVHCPAWTEHVASELARRHRAGVTHETRSPDEAYAGLAPDVPSACDPGWLPGS
jgi:glyoxylate utilization-related uncharacterized protein